MVAGVCGGLGRYFDVNPAFYRVGFVILTLLGGAGILIYGAALLVIPDEGERDSIASGILRDHRQRPIALFGLALVAVAGVVLLSRLSLHLDSGTAWLLALLAGAIILWSQRRRPPAGPGEAQPTPREAPPRRSSPLAAVVGALVVAAGALGLLEANDVDVPWAISLAVGTVAVGLAVIVAGLRQQRVGGLAVLGVVLAVAAVSASTVNLDFADGIGDRTYQPVAATDLRDDYRLGIGYLELDLSDLEAPVEPTRIEAHLGIGELRLIVPADMPVRVLAHVSLGETVLLGHHEDGHDIDGAVGDPEAELVIDARLGMGELSVTRAVR
jgi:phage shock protein PspC (stress-responsive transcriptional regulator)